MHMRSLHSPPTMACMSLFECRLGFAMPSYLSVSHASGASRLDVAELLRVP